MKKKTKEVKSINCVEAVSRFNEFMDNYLQGEARRELMHHISDCKSCLERFEFEQMLKTKVQTLGKDKNKKTDPLIRKIEKLIRTL